MPRYSLVFTLGGVYDETIVTGHVASIDAAGWRPLEQFLPLELCSPFMWMHTVELDDDGVLQAYKHSATRRYLLLDGDAAVGAHILPSSPASPFRRLP